MPIEASNPPPLAGSTLYPQILPFESRPYAQAPFDVKTRLVTPVPVMTEPELTVLPLLGLVEYSRICGLSFAEPLSKTRNPPAATPLAGAGFVQLGEAVGEALAICGDEESDPHPVANSKMSINIESVELTATMLFIGIAAEFVHSGRECELNYDFGYRTTSADNIF
jgi:hypothetical protein